MKEQRWGFTLVELLVVIGIIGILSGLLLTVIVKAKGSGKRAQCLNNLKQWGMATQLFADSNSDFLPPDGSPNGASTNSGWYVDLPRELEMPTYHELEWRTNATFDPGKSIWICPENKRRSNGHNLFHYAVNRHVNGSGTGNQAVLSSIRAADRVVWMFDNGGRAAVAGPNNAHQTVHNHGAHFLFLDGHARRFNTEDYWNFSTERGRTNNRELIWFPRRGGY